MLQALLLSILLALPVSPAAGADRPLDASELGQALRAHIAQTVHCSEADVHVRAAGSVDGITVPDGEVSIRILQKSVPASYRNLLVGVEISREYQPVRTFWVTVDASVRGCFPKVKTRVPYGTALKAGDFEMVQGEIPDLRERYFKTEEEVVGQVARRLLVPGDAVGAGVVVPPYLVRNGQTVRLRVKRERVVVATLVRAEQDGRLGQTVTVRNPDFSRRLKARVVGPGEVTID